MGRIRPGIVGGVAAALLVFGNAFTATADEPPTPPAPPEAPAPPPEGAPAPTEERRVIEMAPPADAAPTPPSPTVRAPAPVYVPPPAPPPVCCPPTACAQPRDECGWTLDSCGNRIGCWEFFAAASMSWYSSPDGRLGELVQGITDPLEWNDVDYPLAFGGRAAIRRRVAAQTLIEVCGAYYGTADENDTQIGNFGAFPGVEGTGDLSRLVEARFDSEAEAWDVELNTWTEVACVDRMRVDVGAGLRYLSFDERARVDFTTLGPGAFPVDDGFAQSQVENDFFGGQVGVRTHWDANNCLTFHTSVKAMFGQISRDIRVTDLDIFAGSFHSSSSDDDEFVFGMDIEVGLTWRLSPKLALNAGAELLFLDNVQRAEDAMDFAHSNTGAVQAVQDPDQLMITTVYVGFTLTL